MNVVSYCKTREKERKGKKESGLRDRGKIENIRGMWLMILFGEKNINGEKWTVVKNGATTNRSTFDESVCGLKDLVR